eukprot:scaffold4009_cov101-Isochrysis_galbana.AAC.2
MGREAVSKEWCGGRVPRQGRAVGGIGRSRRVGKGVGGWARGCACLVGREIRRDYDVDGVVRDVSHSESHALGQQSVAFAKVQGSRGLGERGGGMFQCRITGSIVEHITSSASRSQEWVG